MDTGVKHRTVGPDESFVSYARGSPKVLEIMYAEYLMKNIRTSRELNRRRRERTPPGGVTR